MESGSLTARQEVNLTPVRFPASRRSFDHVVEAGVAMLHAVGHSGGNRAITRFLGREPQVAYERRDAVLFTELNRHDARIADWHGEADVARVEVLFVNDPGRVV